MNSYIINFAVYTFAMIGFIALALFIYKKSVFTNNISKDKNFLQVENSLRISAAKTIYVLKAGKEKFLIAGDAANTTMLAKLDDNNKHENYETVNAGRITEFSQIKKQIHKINRG